MTRPTGASMSSENNGGETVGPPSRVVAQMHAARRQGYLLMASMDKLSGAVDGEAIPSSVEVGGLRISEAYSDHTVDVTAVKLGVPSVPQSAARNAEQLVVMAGMLLGVADFLRDQAEQEAAGA